MRMTVIVSDLFSSDGNAPNLLVGQRRSHVGNYLSLSLLQSTTIKTFTAQQRDLHPTQGDTEEFWTWKMGGLEDSVGGTKGTVGVGPEIAGFWPWKLSPLLQRSQQQQARQHTWLWHHAWTHKPHFQRNLTVASVKTGPTPSPLLLLRRRAPQLLHPHPWWWGPWTFTTKVKVGMGCSVQLSPGPSSSASLPHNGTCFKGFRM